MAAGVLPGSSQPLVARVSRRELASNRYVWLTTGVSFSVLAVISVGIAVLPFGLDQLELLILAALLAIISLIILRTEPASIESPWNHVMLATIYVSAAGGMVAYHPGGSVAIGTVIFVGLLTATRLIDRREIAIHNVLAAACLAAATLVGSADVGTSLATISVVPALWVLTACCVIVLEAAEAQGEELEWLVRRDPLTGAGNSRLLAELLPEEIRRHGRLRRPLSVVLLDLNGFKALNDTVGHAAGDGLLREVTAALQSVARPGDTVIRQGDDDFCLILEDLSVSQAQPFVDAVRATLAQIVCPGEGGITTGIGVASFPKDAVHVGVLLHVASERLAEDKASFPSAPPLPLSPAPNQADVVRGV